MESIKSLKRKRSSRGGSESRANRYSAEFKLKAVRFYLEEKYPLKLLSQELSVGQKAIRDWAAAYQEQGEAGLVPKRPGPKKSSVSSPVTDQIIQLKQEQPQSGVKRISQLLRRLFCLPASPETVRQTLHAHQLLEPMEQPRPRNPGKPRFFERATPNQMWQSDIFTFRLGGHYAYVIAYLDDYSRYVVGSDLFRSHTGEHVLEVYRKAKAEYNPPKEMLTDNGRQYANWRGKTRFQHEMQKDNIHHLRSRPHHPMTLGKIERFWASLYGEFLSRAQFDNFEDARARTLLWVRYYNCKRPHQGIEGLCPADRYFEIQSNLRQIIEQGIQDNILELALRGKPRKPFYMVGRLDGQSVVLRAEKGKLRLSVDDAESKKSEEIIYNLTPGDDTNGETKPEENGATAAQQESGTTVDNGCDAALPGSAGGMDGAAKAGADLPGVGRGPGVVELLAATGLGGNAAGAGTAGEAGRRDLTVAPAAITLGAETPGCSATADPEREAGRAVEPHPGFPESGATADPREAVTRERSVDESQPGVGPTAGTDHHAGTQRPDHGHSGCPAVGYLPEDVLPMGESRLGGDAQSTGRPGTRPPCPVCGYREASPGRTYPGTGATAADGQSAGSTKELPIGI
jgi:transposase InsO family protein